MAAPAGASETGWPNICSRRKSARHENQDTGNAMQPSGRSRRAGCHRAECCIRRAGHRGQRDNGTRDARYCEIISIVRDGLHLVATVYNSLGLNDCPAATWSAITKEAMKERFYASPSFSTGRDTLSPTRSRPRGRPKPGKPSRSTGWASPIAPRSTSVSWTCCTAPIARPPLIATRSTSSRPAARSLCSRGLTAAATSCKLTRRSSTRRRPMTTCPGWAAS